jgi:protein KRI1
LDADWDPEAHERQMAGLYGGEYDIGDDEIDSEKPVWDDDIDIDDIIGKSNNNKAEESSKKKKKKKKKEDGKKATEDSDGVDIDDMDADITKSYDPDEEWDGTEAMRKRKLDEYMDEIYGMDFNDMVSGLMSERGVTLGNANLRYSSRSETSTHGSSIPLWIQQLMD